MASWVCVMAKAFLLGPFTSFQRQRVELRAVFVIDADCEVLASAMSGADLRWSENVHGFVPGAEQGPGDDVVESGIS